VGRGFAEAGWRVVVAAALAVAVAAPGATVAPIFAVDGAASGPIIVSPTGDAASGEPVLRWSPAEGATGYRVQIGTTSTFDDLRYDVLTAATSATPTVDLQPGTYHWRVAAEWFDAKGPWVSSTFTKTPSLGAPTLLSPDDGVVVAGFAAARAPLLSWSPVPGAWSYEMQFSFAPSMSDSFGALRASTSWVPDFDTLGRPVYWRVRARGRNGDTTGPWSPIRSFETSLGGAPTGLSPVDGASVRDLNLDWDPIPGVARYVVQIAPGPVPDWDASEARQIVTTATRVQVEDPNAPIPATWVWRVRARDQHGDEGPWSPSRTVTRVLAPAPSLTTPDDGASVGNNPSLAWTAVVRAGFYEIEVSPDPGFGSGVATYHASEPAFDIPTSEIEPEVMVRGATYHWRVRGIDNPPEQLFAMSRPASPWSATGTFVYEPAISTLISPADGATVDVPTLRWQPVNTRIHRVSIEADDGSIVDRAMTYADSYTPTVELDPADGPFTWYVEHVAQPGGDGALVGWRSAERSFTLAMPSPMGTTPTPLLPTGSHSVAAPSLSWTPVTGAHHYNLFLAPFPAATPVDEEPAPANEVPLHHTAFTYALGNLQVRTYTYLVRAYDASGDLIAHGPTATFTIDALPAPLIVTPAECDDPGCPVYADTPTLSWQPVAGARSYTVGFDSVSTFQSAAITTGLSFRLRGDAGPSIGGGPSSWWVHACVEQRCSSRATSRFLVRLPSIEMASPPDGVVIAGPEVTFAWEDLSATATPAGTIGPHRSEANVYGFGFTTTGNGGGAIVDGLEATVLLEPGAWTWHVVGHTGGGLSTPVVERSVSVVQPGPAPVSPASGSVIDRTPNLGWASTPYTASYELELYRGSVSAASRILATTTVSPAFTPEEELDAGTYTWRVRSVLDGARSSWGSFATFIVQAMAPIAAAPATGHASGTGIVEYSWQPVIGAAAYRFERSANPSFTNLAEVVVTGQTTWSPTSAQSTGTWYWRVAALGASASLLGRTAGRSVVVQLPTAPSVTIAKGQVVSISGVAPVSTTWTENPATASSDTFELARSTEGSAFGIIASGLPTPSALVSLASRHSHILAIRAVDPQGNRSPWIFGPAFNLQRYEETSTKITYQGRWRETHSSAFVAGAAKHARAAGASATFRFTGRQVAWVTTTAPNRGRARIYVDGKLVHTIDLSAPTVQARRVAFVTAWATSTKHTVRIVVLGTSGRPRVDVDAFLTAR
jgi:hypothetical protein